tara:strand:- start:721 stop:1158 length:438 start_codon:yes stop_codon:yes gene_type:complete
MKKTGVEKVGDKVEKVIKDTEEKVVEAITHPFRQSKLTFGQRAADFISRWAGSWGFIMFFFAFIILWMAANVYAWVNTWDLYPFILLNLVLSCLAAVQAPVILMSQNRAAQRDRLRAEYDYSVNRKAEKEIREIKKILTKLKRAS